MVAIFRISHGAKKPAWTPNYKKKILKQILSNSQRILLSFEIIVMFWVWTHNLRYVDMIISFSFSEFSLSQLKFSFWIFIYKKKILKNKKLFGQDI